MGAGAGGAAVAVVAGGGAGEAAAVVVAVAGGGGGMAESLSFVARVSMGAGSAVFPEPEPAAAHTTRPTRATPPTPSPAQRPVLELFFGYSTSIEGGLALTGVRAAGRDDTRTTVGGAGTLKSGAEGRFETGADPG
jgi:hypothetical protein